MVSWVPGSPMDWGGDDADRFADIDRRTAGKVATVAGGAHTLAGFAGQGRTDADRLDLGRLDGHRHGFSSSSVALGNENLAGVPAR